MNKLMGIVNNTNLINGEDGLLLIAKKQLGIDLRELGSGELVAFINRKGDKVKVYAGGGVVAYKRNGAPLDPRVLQHIPKYFGGGVINIDAAMKDVVRTKFPKWFAEKE